jgi:hypothetical protein
LRSEKKKATNLIIVTKKLLKFCIISNEQKEEKKDVRYSRRRRAPFRARSLFLRDPRIVAIVRAFVHFYSLFFWSIYYYYLKKKSASRRQPSQTPAIAFFLTNFSFILFSSSNAAAEGFRTKRDADRSRERRFWTSPRKIYRS